MDHKLKSKWENNKLNLEKECGYEGIIWPQRNFMCNFCKNEYKSAQALGGHMNVHRRDRARLRLSSPNSLDDHSNPNPNPNPNPNFSSPPSPVRYLPYKTYHSSLFPLSSTTNEQDKDDKLPIAANSAHDFLADMSKKTMEMEKNLENDGDLKGNYVRKEECSRVWKKREIFRVEMEMGLLEDGKVDLELRLGRS